MQKWCMKKKKKDRIEWVSGFTKRKPLKNKDSFVCFPVILSQQSILTEVIIFLLSRASEIKDLPISMTYGQIFMKNLNYSVLNSILDEVIVQVEQRFKTMREFRFIELLNPNFFSRLRKKISDGDVFNFGCIKRLDV